jgi:hypothetical protein
MNNRITTNNTIFGPETHAAVERIRASWLPKGTIKSLFDGFRVPEKLRNAKHLPGDTED